MLSTHIITRKLQCLHSNKKGDTIIEVLIAIGIVSLVLVSAYAVTNRNAQATQKIQEQGQAQKLVERQLELMRGFSGAISQDGCLVVNAGAVNAVSGVACKMTADGSGASYTLAIKRPNPSAEPMLYSVSATWDALGGQTANVTMYYRR